jgi:hypothetical protein
MAAQQHWYAQAFTGAFTKTMNLSSDALKVALCTSSYTYSQNADQFFSTPQANEISGTGYTAGGVALGGVNITNGGGVWSFSANNSQWLAASFTAAIAVVYDSTPGSAATDPLLWLFDFGGNQTVVGGTFLIQWNGGASSGQIATVTIT